MSYVVYAVFVWTSAFVHACNMGTCTCKFQHVCVRMCVHVCVCAYMHVRSTSRQTNNDRAAARRQAVVPINMLAQMTSEQWNEGQPRD